MCHCFESGYASRRGGEGRKNRAAAGWKETSNGPPISPTLPHGCPHRAYRELTGKDRPCRPGRIAGGSRRVETAAGPALAAALTAFRTPETAPGARLDAEKGMEGRRKGGKGRDRKEGKTLNQNGVEREGENSAGTVLIACWRGTSALSCVGCARQRGVGSSPNRCGWPGSSFRPLPISPRRSASPAGRIADGRDSRVGAAMFGTRPNVMRARLWARTLR